jgi:hypothetical protein
VIWLLRPKINPAAVAQQQEVREAVAVEIARHQGV